ncbi:DUF6048 family protein [Flavobacterium cellulosilyticum]|uniref:Outer membrane protein beta-barrel domain-containing protein n=1 Tax=Flavobacterium cellulosilyticum TaxID=2541731 RepID=A0A4R5C613_9FLAO|nr:DUF6048 family protein [Flavobacterium cellulosilyticum]TDD94119.1 hypothetical protein E0F76_17665 [Flavobacterium cellulosilyticum]
MKHTLKYIFSFCFLMSLFLVQAQKTVSTPTTTDQNKLEGKITEAPKQDLVKPAVTSVSDTIPVKMNRYGVRVGVDLYKLTRGFYDSNYKGVELVGDYRLTKNYYLAAELGNENKTTVDSRLTSTAKGTYIKAGFDYNGYENWLNMENIISIGLRYGMSTFNQQLDSFKIYNPNPYWGELPSIPSGEKYSGLTAGWIEVVAGLKVKVINNIFVGFSLRMNTLLFNKQPDNFENLYIPGFNRTYAGNFGAGFNYTVTYFVPLYKKKAIPKKNN